MSPAPIIAIVGRPNVGKSTLFNRLAGQRLAVVHERAGVTRDRLSARVESEGRRFYLVDTGGISMGDEELDEKTTESALEAVEQAQLILFLVDVRTGVTAEDQAVARVLRRHAEHVWLLANKVERGEDHHAVHELHALGLGEPLAVSALHGEGIPELWQRLLARYPEAPAAPEEDRRLHLALVGRPNVGKSSLANALLGAERMIVSEIPGTTRDAVDSSLRWHGREIVLVDTAGLRKKARVKERLELYSNLRSLAAIDRADVVLLVLDATRSIGEQDQKIAAHAHEAGRGLIILLNKWDLVEKDDATLGEFLRRVRRELEFVDYAPVQFVSAITRQRIHKVLEAAWKIYAERGERLPTARLNGFVQELQRRRPPHHYRGGSGKIYYATQVSGAPPTFALFVNNPDWFPEHYRRFLARQFRRAFGLEGSRIRIRLKPRQEKA